MSLPKITTKKIILGYAVWWSAWTLLEAYAVISMTDFPWRDAVKDAVSANLIMGATGYVIVNSLRFYQPSKKNRFYLFIWSLGLTGLSVAGQQFLANKFLFDTDVVYLAFFNNSLIVRAILSWLMIALIGVLSWVWFYIQDQQASEKRERDAAQLAREAELFQLRQQLQPHFLFNSLNSISALAGSRPEEARRMIQQLSDFLRGTLKKDDQQLVTLSDELEHLKLYLEIEKVRFGHRLNTVIEHDETSDVLKLPALLLQPIVENAIKFGLYDTIGDITIKLSAKAIDKQLIVTVENPFDPTTTQPKGTGFGLNSVQRRLYLLFARNDLLSTRQHENIFITEIKIPQLA